jgi:hypothetical protein
MTVHPPRKRLSTDVIGALVSAVERQRAVLPADSPRRRLSLSQLKFMRPHVDARGPARPYQRCAWDAVR